jgi:hypothetical protein
VSRSACRPSKVGVLIGGCSGYGTGCSENISTIAAASAGRKAAR